MHARSECSDVVIPKLRNRIGTQHILRKELMDVCNQGLATFSFRSLTWSSRLVILDTSRCFSSLSAVHMFSMSVMRLLSSVMGWGHSSPLSCGGDFRDTPTFPRGGRMEKMPQIFFSQETIKLKNWPTHLQYHNVFSVRHTQHMHAFRSVSQALRATSIQCHGIGMHCRPVVNVTRLKL